MLSLGHILISDLVVTNVIMHSLPTLLGHDFFTPKVFLHEYHHFCKVNNNCYKQIINASCWEILEKVANTLQLNCLN